MPDLAAVINREYLHEHRALLAYAAGAILLFLIFLIGTFPYDQALSGALMPMGVQIAYDSERPGIPVGVVFEGVRLLSLEHPGAPPLVQSDSLKLMPGLAMLIGRPAVTIRAAMYDGLVKASLWRSGDTTGMDLRADAIDLSRYPMPGLPGVVIKGIVSGNAALQSFGPALTSQSGTVSLDGHDVEFPLIKGLPAVRFAHLQGSATIDRATLRINLLEGSGPDMTLTGSGVIHLAPTLTQTMIDLTMRITPTVAGRVRLGVLFAFLPHPPDNRPYILHGPLLMPQAN